MNTNEVLLLIVIGIVSISFISLLPLLIAIVDVKINKIKLSSIAIKRAYALALGRKHFWALKLYDNELEWYEQSFDNITVTETVDPIIKCVNWKEVKKQLKSIELEVSSKSNIKYPSFHKSNLTKHIYNGKNMGYEVELDGTVNFIYDGNIISISPDRIISGPLDFDFLNVMENDIESITYADKT